MANLDGRQLHILRHALGIGDDGTRAAYRNHFVTGEGGVDHPHCMALVESGHMVRRDGSMLTGGDDLFLVTDAGRAAARPAQAAPLSRSQQRYQRFLDADSGLTFGEWLRCRDAHGRRP